MKLKMMMLVMAFAFGPKPKGTSFLLPSFSSLGTCIWVCGFRSLAPSNQYQKNLLHLKGTRLSDFLKSRCRTGFNCVEDALILFDHMTALLPLPNVIHFTQLLSSVARMKEYSTAAVVFKSMILLDNIPYDAHTINIAINCYCHLNPVDTSIALLGRILKLGYRADAVTYNTLLNGLCLDDRVLDSMDLFNRMMKWKEFWPTEADAEPGFTSEDPDVVTFDALMDGYCLHGDTDKAMKVFTSMVSKGIAPDQFSYNILINGYCKVTEIDKAMDLFQEMEDKGIKPDLVSYNTLIHGLFQVKRSEAAIELFNKRKDAGLTPSVVSFNIMLDGLCKDERLSDALSLLREMDDSRIDPTIATYTILIDAFCKDAEF